MEYIISMKSEYNWERFIEIEARAIPNEEDRIMATLMTLEQAQRDRGRQEGEARKQSEIAENMIRAGVDDQDIVNYTGVSVESVADLKRKLNGG